MKLSQEDFKRKKQREQQRREFNKKIEEDRLGISRIKKKRTMKFRTYRIIKLTLLFLTVLSFFLYSPALLPIIILDALMLIFTKQIERTKNKNITKKYRIKVFAVDSVIAILLIVFTFSMFSYSAVQAFRTSSEFNSKTDDQLKQELIAKGVPSQAVTFMLERQKQMNSGETLIKQAITSALTLNTGERNVITGMGYSKKRGMTRISKPPDGENFAGSGVPPAGGGGNIVIKEKGGETRSFALARQMPLEAIFKQILSGVCMVIVGGLVIAGIANIISGRKLGEIKEITIDSKFLEQLSPNSECPCGSGKKYKNCCMNEKDSN